MNEARRTPAQSFGIVVLSKGILFLSPLLKTVTSLCYSMIASIFTHHVPKLKLRMICSLRRFSDIELIASEPWDNKKTLSQIFKS